MRINDIGTGYLFESGSPVSSFTTSLYMIYVCSFFLHLAERIPGISIIRPDLIIVIAIAVMLFAQNEKLKGRLNNSIAKILYILIAYIILTLPFVEWPGSVIKANASDFIKSIVFFFFTILTIDTNIRLKRFILLIILCQLFRVLEPLYLHLVYGYWGSMTYLGDGEFANRLSGAPFDIINPNELAFVIVTVFTLIHYLWWGGRWKSKLLYLCVCIPLFTALFLTLSRSGFVALLAVIWNIYLKSSKKIILIGVVSISALLILGMMNDVQRDRYFSITGAQNTRSYGTFQGRFNAMEKDFQVALKRPIFGFGLGTSMEAKGNLDSGYQISHILYIEVLIELGIIGLTIFTVFLCRIYKVTRKCEGLLIKILAKPSTNSVRDMYLYERNLLSSLTTCFWMFLVFSIAQYGLSRYHWYLLAGLTILLQEKLRCVAGNRA